jgi:hypothetical protein
MAEVEAQLVRSDVGPRLANMTAKPLAQRSVKQVGSGVIARGRVPGGVVDARDYLLARL